MLAQFADAQPGSVTRKMVDKPHSFDVGLRIGTLEAVIYNINGDRRIHRFKKGSAPDLVSSLDGKQLAVIGGRYQFTSRGIVDF